MHFLYCLHKSSNTGYIIISNIASILNLLSSVENSIELSNSIFVANSLE